VAVPLVPAIVALIWYAATARKAVRKRSVHTALLDCLDARFLLAFACTPFGGGEGGCHTAQGDFREND